MRFAFDERYWPDDGMAISLGGYHGKRWVTGIAVLSQVGAFPYGNPTGSGEKETPDSQLLDLAAGHEDKAETKADHLQAGLENGSKTR